ncbi:MAG: hypothetical protein GX577_13180 [Leptolinea sp.]|nr:hypothetical protein [Leptolinea sp.]
MKNRNFYLLFALLLMACSLPSITGFLNQDAALSYSGVVFNPIDGYTYLAKMQIGKSGEWLFTLPYTPLAGEGRLLYPFYIAAGHSLRLLGVDQAVGFTLLRLVSYFLLVLSIVRLTSSVFSENQNTASLGTILAAFGGGLGWVMLPFGKFGADFWISEAFPFLSGLANPHFPLALCLMTVIILIPNTGIRNWTSLILILTGIGLSVLSPFGFILTASILAGSWIWEKADGINTSIWPVIFFVISGVPYCVYQYWAVHSTPQLAAWTAQNLTPSPAAWDVFLTFSPWIGLIVVSWKEIFRLRKLRTVRHLVVWVILGLVFTLIPFNLQRRFMIGLSIPFTVLGLLALPFAAKKIRISIAKMQTICTSLVLITPILLVVMTTMAIATHNDMYYYKKGEKDVILWLSQQGDGRHLTMASGETGLLIPSLSRLRIVYGHPFETVNAEKALNTVEIFYEDKDMIGLESELSIIQENQVEWVMYGANEKELGSPAILKGQEPAFESNEVKVYDVRDLLP